MHASPGDAIVFDYRVMHRGRANKGEAWRPILYETFSRRWFVDDYNFPEISLKQAIEDKSIYIAR